jgi:hypothetical protein
MNFKARAKNAEKPLGSGFAALATTKWHERPERTSLMFDANKFKRSVKEWVRENPNGTVDELVDYCEELIPPNQFTHYSWLLEQTSGWYQHILDTRKSSRFLEDIGSEDVA